MRATVCWSQFAQDDLAELWLSSDLRESIEFASNEVDQLLRVDPGSKGRPFALATLSEPAMQQLERRTQSLPEDLRWLSFGPLEFYFIAKQQDCMVIVAMVTHRKSR